MLLALALQAAAIEGMWEPSQLLSLGQPLRSTGYLDDPARLADLRAAPLGAVVSLGGCTASFVSDLGLLVTNHHCVVGHLQRAQKEGEDLVETGFYAPARQDERSGGKAARVFVTQSFEDVTEKVAGKIPAKTDDVQRKALIDERTKKLVADCEKPGGLRCRVASYYEGLRYTLVRQLELRDVRLVMAPPDAVGNYGDEIDNWHWPRHAGDFAFLRAYIGRDGKPADYSPDNVPYAPPQRLVVSPRGISPGEFVMIAGYPGHTERWRTAGEVERDAALRLPAYIDDGTWALDMLESVARELPSEAVKVNVPRSYLSNGVFNARWTLEAFKRTNVVGAATARDEALRRWVNADSARAATYDPVLTELAARVSLRDADFERDRVMGWVGRSDLLSTARSLYRWSRERQKPDAKREIGYQSRDEARYAARLADMQASLSFEAERRLLEHFLARAIALPAGRGSAELLAWVNASGPAGNPETMAKAAVARLFADPALASAESRLAWFKQGPAAFEASRDGFISLAVALRPYDDARERESKDDAGAYARLRPRYAEAMRLFDPTRVYADANGTLRVTFGTVQGYRPRDAVTYAPQTTVHGVVEKMGPHPFDPPAALVSAIGAGKWGSYADPALGTVPVDFLSDLDITGGNSGSPTLDAKGRLVGLAFDGNVEGIASDYVFDAQMARTIHVDVRYLLWYLDAVAQADGLLRELGLEPTL